MGVGGLLLLILAGRAVVPVLRAELAILPAGALAVAVYPLSFYTSMWATGVAAGTVLTLGSAPMFAALIECALDRARLDMRWACAATISVTGVFLLVTDTAPGEQARHSELGVLLGLLAGAAYATYSWIAGRMMRRGHGSRAVVGALFGAGSMLLLPILAMTGGPLLGSVSGIAVAGYLAIIPMGLAYMLFGAGLRHTPTTVATTLSLLEPAVAALLSVVVVGEHLGTRSWAGMALIGAGLVLVSARRRVSPASGG